MHRSLLITAVFCVLNNDGAQSFETRNAAPQLSSAGKQKRIFNLAETEDSEARVDRSKICLCFLLGIVQILCETQTRVPCSHLFLKLRRGGGIPLHTAMLLLHNRRPRLQHGNTGLRANLDKSVDEMVDFLFFFYTVPAVRNSYSTS